MLASFLLLALLFAPTQELLRSEFGEREGAFVLVDCQTGEWMWTAEEACKTPLPPCSTFKIWNTAFGFETGILTDPDQPFYKWDGKKRFVEDWNQDLTLRKAYEVSCVPAYQQLAREIGSERMSAWIEKIGYGDKNTSAGLDVFWLPDEGRKTLLISPFEQVDLIRRLVQGELPFSAKTAQSLKEVMWAAKTERGVLYGKTGTAMGPDNKPSMGWYVGYVESGGKTYAFACVLHGTDIMGKEARALTEQILRAAGLL